MTYVGLLVLKRGWEADSKIYIYIYKSSVFNLRVYYNSDFIKEIFCELIKQSK